MESYNEYLRIYAATPYLTDEEKHQFGAVNPERFLFGERVAMVRGEKGEAVGMG